MPKRLRPFGVTYSSSSAYVIPMGTIAISLSGRATS